MRNPEMSFRSFIYNLILIALMFVGFVAASYIGMEAAIKHMDGMATVQEQRELAGIKRELSACKTGHHCQVQGLELLTITARRAK